MTFYNFLARMKSYVQHLSKETFHSLSRTLLPLEQVA